MNMPGEQFDASVRSDADGLVSARRTILHFVSTFAIKTDTKWLLQLAAHLDRTRFRLVVACFYEGGPMRQALERKGIETHNLDVPGRRSPRAILRARRLIRRVRPDLVHTHLLRADLFAGLAARWARVPVIVSTVYAIGEFRRERPRWGDSILDSLYRVLPTHVLAVSDAVRRDCVENLRVDPRRVVTIRTGIDPPPAMDAARADALRRGWGVRAGERIVLAIGRLSFEKGIDVLIDAAAVLRDRRCAARFVIVGDGPLRPALQAQIARLQLDDTVCLDGFREDVWDCLAAADVVCMPSKMEGMPNALLEALSARRPVVATRVGGIPEAIEDGRSGLLVPPGDAVALADALQRILTNAELAESVAVGGRAVVDAGFLAKDVVARYAAWYDELLSRTEAQG